MVARVMRKDWQRACEATRPNAKMSRSELCRIMYLFSFLMIWCHQVLWHNYICLMHHSPIV